jgi:hypothetical protein
MQLSSEHDKDEIFGLELSAFRDYWTAVFGHVYVYIVYSLFRTAKAGRCCTRWSICLTNVWLMDDIPLKSIVLVWHGGMILWSWKMLTYQVSVVSGEQNTILRPVRLPAKVSFQLTADQKRGSNTVRPRSFSQDPILDLICSTPGMSGSMFVTHSLPVTIPACNHSLPAVRLLVPAHSGNHRWQSRNRNTALISLGHVRLLVVLNKCWSTTNTSHEIHCKYIAAKTGSHTLQQNKTDKICHVLEFFFCKSLIMLSYM